MPGHSLHREIELYVKAGLSPFDALAAATIVPARVMKKEAESGTIEKGKRGDLIVLDGNPLDDIRNTRRIHRVITNGRVFDPAPLWRSVGFHGPDRRKTIFRPLLGWGFLKCDIKRKAYT